MITCLIKRQPAVPHLWEHNGTSYLTSTPPECSHHRAHSDALAQTSSLVSFPSKRRVVCLILMPLITVIFRHKGGPAENLPDNLLINRLNRWTEDQPTTRKLPPSLTRRFLSSVIRPPAVNPDSPPPSAPMGSIKSHSESRSWTFFLCKQEAEVCVVPWHFLRPSGAAFCSTGSTTELEKNPAVNLSASTIKTLVLGALAPSEMLHGASRLTLTSKGF